MSPGPRSRTFAVTRATSFALPSRSLISTTMLIAAQPEALLVIIPRKTRAPVLVVVTAEGVHFSIVFGGSVGLGVGADVAVGVGETITTGSALQPVERPMTTAVSTFRM